MTALRTLALGAALVVSATTVASAQTTETRPAGAMQQGRPNPALKGIDLTPAQQAKLDSISAKYRTMMPAMTPPSPGTPPDTAAMMKRREMMTQRNAEIRAILTPDQQKMFDKNVAEMQSMQRKPSMPPKPPTSL